MTPEFVRNCYDNVREQEDYYRHLHNHEPLPVEEVEEVEELEEDEEVVEAVEAVEAVDAVVAVEAVEEVVEVEMVDEDVNPEPVQIHTEKITAFTFDEFGEIVEEVEEVEMVDDEDFNPQPVEIDTEEVSALTFDEFGQMIPPTEEEDGEIIETPVTPNSYTCSLCNYSTNIFGYFSKHEKSHHHCDVCGEQFYGSNGKRAFNIHVKKHQPKQPKKSYSCLECDKIFKYPSELNRHMNGVHKSSCKRKIDFQQEEASVVTVGGPTTEDKNPGQQLDNPST